MNGANKVALTAYPTSWRGDDRTSASVIMASFRSAWAESFSATLER
jgi:hypothetical protein